jgi:tetratricopeptide (TPR) repeat protein
MSGVRLLPILLMAFSMTAMFAQTAAPAAPADAAAREALMKPALEALRKGDDAAALVALKPALAAYPNDPQILSDAAFAAMGAKQYPEAIGFFNRALANHPPQQWPLRIAILTMEAKTERWPEFDRDLAALRAAKVAGEHELDSSSGFLIDRFESGGQPVQAVVFPKLAGRYHTLYRFMLPPVAGAIPPANCAVTNFRPYFDVESDDVDQDSFRKQHPDKAAKGERSYSLDTYPAPCSQGLIKFYADGEPTYQAVRADVIRALSAAEKGSKP